MSNELLPCPFCGGKASYDHDDNGWNWIFCTACDASTNARVSAMDDCKPLLREQWNKRVPLKVVAYANRDELDNMMDDRTATVAGVKDGWRGTPLYAATSNVEFSEDAPLHGAASAGTQGYASGGEK